MRNSKQKENKELYDYWLKFLHDLIVAKPISFTTLKIAEKTLKFLYASPHFNMKLIKDIQFFEEDVDTEEEICIYTSAITDYFIIQEDNLKMYKFPHAWEFKIENNLSYLEVDKKVKECYFQQIDNCYKESLKNMGILENTYNYD